MILASYIDSSSIGKYAWANIRSRKVEDSFISEWNERGRQVAVDSPVLWSPYCQAYRDVAQVGITTIGLLCNASGRKRAVTPFVRSAGVPRSSQFAAERPRVLEHRSALLVRAEMAGHGRLH